MTGNIFNIQRYSIQDGPGIRTTVFLKGCPLRCPWCANPESWAMTPELFYTQSKCINCFSCAYAAADQEIQQEEGGLTIDRERAVGETAVKLARVCPTGALSVKYREIGAEELFLEIEKDRPFYEKSQGGVTFSGGEPMLQKDFLAEILKRCKESGLHTAIETTGCVSWEAFEAVAGYADLYLYDVKHIDGDIHKKYTGVDNGQILRNLQRLRERKEEIHVRVPVIPGFNDSAETLGEIRRLLDRLGIQKRTLLPFHQYGSSKFKALGIPYAMEGVAQMDEKRLKQLAEESRFYG